MSTLLASVRRVRVRKAMRRMQAANATVYTQPANDRIVAALRSVRSANASLASAGSAENRTRYNAGRKLATARERQLRAAVAGPKDVGVGVSG